MLIAGCEPSEEARATQTAVAVEATVVVMPLSSSPKLYLGFEDNLSPDPITTSGTITQYLYGERKSFEWTMQLDDESLADNYTYDLVMASAGTSNATIELVLRQGSQETVLGEDTFVIDSTYYLPYQGQFSGSNAAATNGDQVTLRLTVSGDDFGITLGGVDSSISILEAPDTTAAIAEERTKALTWVATNITFGPNVEILTSDLFTHFRYSLDSAILSGDNARWVMGWGLTISGKPYSIEWANEVFSVEEISVEEAQEADVEEMTMEITSELNP
jgi:hypothetical protein